MGHTRKIENSIKVHNNKKTRNITIGHVIKSGKITKRHRKILMNAIGHKIKTGKTTMRHKRTPGKLHSRAQKTLERPNWVTIERL